MTQRISAVSNGKPAGSGRDCVGLGVVLLSLLLFQPGYARAETFAGRISVIDSGPKAAIVNVVRPGKKCFAQLKAGDQVFAGDTVKTSAEVRVKLEMADSSVINLGPGSTFRIKGYSLKQEEGQRSSVFKVLKGTVRFIIAKVTNSVSWRDSNVVVETPVAVAGVRGTDFIVSVRTDAPAPEVEIAVLDEGEVTARNGNLKIKGTVTLLPRQRTIVSRGSSPAEPSALSIEEREALLNATTPSGNGNPANGKPAAKGKAVKYTDSDMERDIAAGVPLPQVFEQAIATGMALDKMVSAAVDAGVAGYTVVYTAISEGYSATTVVCAAIEAGVPLREVVAAAVMAGAEAKAIIAGAQLAGVPEEEIAAALADSANIVSPVYGHPDPKAPSMAPPPLPGAMPMFGGGGGATPSTKKASPYKP